MKTLTEEDIKYRYISPAVEKAGWVKNQVLLEYFFTAGQMLLRGNTAKRGKRKKADYLLTQRARSNPKLMLIHFHTFRHWKGTTEQHKTKDPWHVKEILGHKSIKSTEAYIHLEQMMYEETNDQFTVKVANTMAEAIKLMEVGFEYHTEIEGNKLFRKRN
jgi:integrase